MAANNIYIQVDLNATTAQANVNALNNALALTGPASQKSAQQTTTALNSVNISVSQTTKAFEELTQAMAGLGIVRIAQNIIQVGTELNRAQQAMAAFVGSAQEAAEVTEKIAAVAAQEPFKFKDLEETGRRLAGFGLQAKEIPTYLKVISDQAAAMGGSIETVNNIVTLFGRGMEKNVIGAMDVMRLLPAQGIKIQKALTDALGKQQLGATFDDVKKAMKEGALDPTNTWLVLLHSMQEETKGAGARMNDFAMIMKNIGDAFDRAKAALLSEKGFGPALRTLGEEIATLLAPIAGLIKLLMGLPEPLKVLTVNLVAGTAAVIAFAGAWKLFSTVASPAITVMKGLATVLSGMRLPALGAAAPWIAGIGAAIYGLTLIFPETTQKFLNWVSDLWQKMKTKTKSLVQEAGLWPKDVKLPGLPEAGPLAKETDENLKAVQKQVQEWADAAGKTMLNALSSPAEAVVMKYKDLFDKLDEQLKTKFITPEHAGELRDQLEAARKIEMDSKLMEKRKQDIAELYKGELEAAKSAYDAQILYIEAQDAQNLRTKVEHIDKITRLREESAATTARLEKEQLEDVYNAQVAYFEQYRKLFEAAGVNVDIAEQNLREEVNAKQKNIDKKAVDDQQKYRLEGWKKANDAIIEDQKRVYEAFQSMFDEIFDAFTNKTKSIGQALGDVFKKLALGEVRNFFSSQAAAFATEAAGYGQPEPGIRRSGGILGILMQRGMPPRPMMAPPEGYNPAKAESGISFGNIVGTGGQGGANRIADAAGVYNVSAIVFANAVNRFSDATIQHQGSADRMVESSATISEASDAISRASQATGVPTSVLRAVAQTESNFNRFAVGPMTRYGQAKGMFQLMPSTMQDWGITNPFDPYQSAIGGAEQLQRLYRRYGEWPAALAAYNYGPTNYDRAMAAGRPLPRETQLYVQKIMGALGGEQAGAPTFAPATRPFQLPPGFAMEGGQLSYETPGMAGADVGATDEEARYLRATGGAAPAVSFEQLVNLPMRGGGADIGSLTTIATPTEVAEAKQASVLSQIVALGKGSGQSPTGILQNLQKTGGLAGLAALFGIGQARGAHMGSESMARAAAAEGAPTAVNFAGTNLRSILTSKGVAQLAAVGGMMIAGVGLNKRIAPLTVAGGALAGFGMRGTFGMSPLQGLGLGAGLGLVAAGVQRGGGVGLAMDIGGGALAGAAIGSKIAPGIGTLIGAAVGAAAGAVTGVVRLFIQTEQERIRSQIKQVYGIDIPNRQILTQIQQIVDQNYGGSVSVGVRSQEVQNLVRLYALSTGQAANMPRPMYAATIAQSTQGLQLQPVYQGGTAVANPYSGPTTYQYQTAVAQAMGLKSGTSLGVPGAGGIISQQWQNLALETIRGNPSAVAMAGAAAATAGDSRLTTTQAMQEPLTALS